jgi:hypothetical protein
MMTDWYERTIKALQLNGKGGDLSGFSGVLHTWGRMVQYHPHIHYIVPGGALSKKDGKWHPSRLDFYLPVKALSKIYKAKFQDLMKNKRRDYCTKYHPKSGILTGMLTLRQWAPARQA